MNDLASEKASKPATLCPKVILEGTRLTNKTELAFALNEHPGFVGPRKYRYHSPIISGEWSGYTNTPWGRGLTSFLPEETELAKQTLDAWLTVIELHRYYSWIIDRFQLSAQLHHRRSVEPVTGEAFDVGPTEKRLKDLGFHLILCTRREDSFVGAREERLKVSGNPSQYDDLTPFVEEQRAMRALAETSLLPVMVLDVSDNDIARAADRVVAYLRTNNALGSSDPAGASIVDRL
ncbi:hypothetical protein [Mucisphaera sp.]|uniref:hypothetical protein n=1 Tax=Mucisphaera sp. TaxID=2913024 RepID=UPI003D10731F